MGEILKDQYGEYDANAGMDEPEDGRCNARLKHWPERYGEVRYCGKSPRGCGHHGYECDCTGFCNTHQYKKNHLMRAKELYQHGGYTKNRELLYDKCDPWDQIVMHALHESLMEDSVHEFAPEFKERRFNFDNSEYTLPEDAPKDGNEVILDVAYPTENIDRGKVLWAAAVDGVKMENVNAKIAEDMMEVEHTSHAQLTSPTEANPQQNWMKLEEKREHHLNLAYSRLATDREKLLSYGGIVTGTKADIEDNSQVIEEFSLVEPDPQNVDGNGSGMADL